MERLVLQDSEGKVVRAFEWSGEPVQVIRRGDTRRLELLKSVDELTQKKIPFESLGELSREGLQKNSLLIGELGHLQMIESVGDIVRDQQEPQENRRVLFVTLAALGLVSVSLISALRNAPPVPAKVDEEMQQKVVKIVKSLVKPPPPKTLTTSAQSNVPATTQSNRASTIKRMGALSALGSLNSGKQRGGLNLGAAQTSAGPGLGGTEGSGGTQTSLYALGAGGNVQGAGGYGTKGRGGGQAGYGKLALTGSTGASAIPLGTEANVAKGLDRDQIAAVINRNQGQVRFCYEQGLQSDPALNGRVAVDFTIGGNGMVKEAGVGSSTLKAKTVEDCIVMRLKSWKFPLPDGGVDVKVSYPFTLRRSGQG